MTPEYPVRIVSDLHYKIPGARLKTKDDLRPLFAGARTVILGGDSVEQLLYGTVKAAQHLEDLKEVARHENATLHFVRGNHDPENGVPEIRFVHQGRTIRIQHGDFGVLQLENSPDSAFRRPFSYAWYVFKTFKSYPVYWRQIKMAFPLMKEGEILVLGHTHQPSVTVDGGRVVVNLGAHMKGFRSAVIEIEGPDAAPVFIGDKRVELTATPTP